MGGDEKSFEREGPAAAFDTERTENKKAWRRQESGGPSRALAFRVCASPEPPTMAERFSIGVVNAPATRKAALERVCAQSEGARNLFFWPH